MFMKLTSSAKSLQRVSLFVITYIHCLVLRKLGDQWNEHFTRLSIQGSCLLDQQRDQPLTGNSELSGAANMFIEHCPELQLT